MNNKVGWGLGGRGPGAHEAARGKEQGLGLERGPGCGSSSVPGPWQGFVTESAPQPSMAGVVPTSRKRRLRPRRLFRTLPENTEPAASKDELPAVTHALPFLTSLLPLPLPNLQHAFTEHLIRAKHRAVSGGDRSSPAHLKAAGQRAMGTLWSLQLQQSHNLGDNALTMPPCTGGMLLCIPFPLVTPRPFMIRRLREAFLGSWAHGHTFPALCVLCGHSRLPALLASCMCVILRRRVLGAH